MKVESFLAHYERIADTPDTIARLRRFILDLAVRGKLFEPNYKVWTEKPIENCLERLPDGRFIHQGWSPQCESNPSPHERQWGVLKTTAIQDGYFLPDKNKELPRKFQPKPQLEVRPGDILITCAGPRARCGIACLVSTVRGKLMISGKMYRFRADANDILPGYLTLFLRSSDAQAAINEMKTGSSESGLNLTKDRFKQLPIRFGSIAEQKKIIVKVDELMVLCDRLETARVQREATRDRLAVATFTRLSSLASITFRDDIRFVLGVLPALTKRRDHVKKIRQTILNFAVRGKFSAQGAWQAKPTKVGSVATLQNGYAFKSGWFSKLGTRLLRNANVGHGILNWDEEVRLSDSLVAEYERFRLREGDIVLSLDRPFIATGTKVARVKSEDLPALLLQRVGRFILSPTLDPDYLYLWINSPHFSEQIDPGRSNGVPHISSKQVEAAVLFLPPLAEQRRIVAKADELIALCDRLEANLMGDQAVRARLLEAVLAEAIAPQSRTREAAE